MLSINSNASASMATYAMRQANAGEIRAGERLSSGSRVNSAADDAAGNTVDSKSGYSGAGRGVHKKYKNQNLYESISAYGVGFHRHNPEIEQTLKKYSKKKIEFNFTPHLTPMFRGILSTIYIEVKKNVSQNKIKKVLTDYYKNDIFIKILKNDSSMSTNDVINTNRCHISVCKTKNTNKFIILSIIDNLIKGGSGQAVQNMNLKFGFPLKTGLI